MKNDPHESVKSHNNFPCWLKWNPTTKRWDKHFQPDFTGTGVSRCNSTTTCAWYVDTDARGDWVIAAYVDKWVDDVFLWAFKQTAANGIDFNDWRLADVLDGATVIDQDGKQFAAVGLDDEGCAYLLSVVKDATSPKTTAYHIDLTAPFTPTPAGRVIPVHSSHALNADVNGDDGGDLVVLAGRAVTIYSDGDTEYNFYISEHTILDETPVDLVCAGGWTSQVPLNETAFDDMSSIESEQVDGHVAMAPGTGGWYAVMKTSAPNNGDKPIIVLAREFDEDIYEIVDRDDLNVRLPHGGVSRPSVWMDPGDFPRLLVAYQDGANPRNTVVQRWASIPEADPDGDGELIEWEKKELLSQNLWPRLVFSRCEDENRVGGMCPDNLQDNGAWRGAAWSAVRFAGTSNFLMAVEGDVTDTTDFIPPPPPDSVDNELITAEIDWQDWGCDDHYDNDADLEPDPDPADAGIDEVDDGCDTGASGTAPEDTACSDRIDNDGDGKIDLSGGPSGELADPQCANIRDNAEHAVGCGLGFEAGVALMAIAAARELRRWTRRLSGDRPDPASSS